MPRVTSALATVLVTSTFLAAGCANRISSTDNAAVAGGSDAFSAETDAETLSSTFIGGSGTGTLTLATDSELSGDVRLQGSSSTTLQGIGDNAKAFYQPAGCLVVTDDPTKKIATYAFSDCTGPYGLVHINGTVNVDYSASTATSLALLFSASGLKINSATVDWQASANVTGQGSARDMIWDGHFAGTTGSGRAFERTNHKEYKWTVGVACLSVAGSSDGTVTGKEIKVDVINYSRCLGACPEAGSEVRITDVTANLVYDLKYNAGDATYTDPKGRSFDFHPFCAL